MDANGNIEMINPRWLKRTLFLVAFSSIAALEGFFIGPLGGEWLLGSLAFTAALGTGWTRLRRPLGEME
jgi:hypothetical protein